MIRRIEPTSFFKIAADCLSERGWQCRSSDDVLTCVQGLEQGFEQVFTVQLVRERLSTMLSIIPRSGLIFGAFCELWARLHNQPVDHQFPVVVATGDVYTGSEAGYSLRLCEDDYRSVKRLEVFLTDSTSAASKFLGTFASVESLLKLSAECPAMFNRLTVNGERVWWTLMLLAGRGFEIRAVVNDARNQLMALAPYPGEELDQMFLRNLAAEIDKPTGVNSQKSDFSLQ